MRGVVAVLELAVGHKRHHHAHAVLIIELDQVPDADGPAIVVIHPDLHPRQVPTASGITHDSPSRPAPDMPSPSPAGPAGSRIAPARAATAPAARP